MKISIVTISFNQAEYIERAIQSVLIQKETVDLEYIMVDAGSTDGSRKIINQYSQEIDTIIFEQDEGPADGLNKGFKTATGEIYGYLNADDEYKPACLNQVERYFIENSHVDVLSGHGEILDRESHFVQKCFSHKFNLQRYAEGSCVVVQQSTFFKAAAFHSVGGFNINNTISWDGELMVDMALSGTRFRRVTNVWSGFRVYDSSISGSGSHLEKAKQEHDRIARKIGLRRPKNRFIIKLNWLIYRLADPQLVLARVWDGVVNGKRVIPKLSLF